jgi:acyl-CoA synthetase (AMP-forming)/AMP-acid ligase II
MDSTTITSPGRGEDVTAGVSSICAAFQATATRHRDQVALRLPGEGIEWRWGQYAARVRRAAETLYALGVRRGDAVAILLRNRPEYFVADMATRCIWARHRSGFTRPRRRSRSSM